MTSNGKNIHPRIGFFEPELIQLRDGTSLLLRPIRPEDAHYLQLFHARLSAKSVYYRFLGPHRDLLDKEATYFTNVDYRHRMALVAIDELDGEGAPGEIGYMIVGVARYDMLVPTELDVAEAAFVVEDVYQGKGLGTVLLDRLRKYALKKGIHVFQFTVHCDNTRMLRLLKRSGDVINKIRDSGICEIRIHLTQKEK